MLSLIDIVVLYLLMGAIETFLFWLANVCEFTIGEAIIAILFWPFIVFILIATLIQYILKNKI